MAEPRVEVLVDVLSDFAPEDVTTSEIRQLIMQFDGDELQIQRAILEKWETTDISAEEVTNPAPPISLRDRLERVADTYRPTRNHFLGNEDDEDASSKDDSDNDDGDADDKYTIDCTSSEEDCGDDTDENIVNRPSGGLRAIGLDSLGFGLGRLGTGVVVGATTAVGGIGRSIGDLVRRNSFVEEDNEDEKTPSSRVLIRKKEEAASHQGKYDPGGIGRNNQNLLEASVSSLEDDLYVMVERREESRRLWLNLTLEHLNEFLEAYMRVEFLPGADSQAWTAFATYERWISELHPENASYHETNRREKASEQENVTNSSTLTNSDVCGAPKVSAKARTGCDSLITIDARFYLPDSDHLLMWNEHPLVGVPVAALASAHSGSSSHKVDKGGTGNSDDLTNSIDGLETLRAKSEDTREGNSSMEAIYAPAAGPDARAIEVQKAKVATQQRFKEQQQDQLQKVDILIFEKIVSRYHVLDVDNSGALDVGVEIPSAQQVKELQRIAAAEVSERHLKEQRPLRIIWNEQRGRLTSNTIASEEIESPRCGGTNLKKETSEKVKSTGTIECGQYFTRLTECFDFKWSKNLWKSASKSTGKWRMWLVLIYVTLSLVFSWDTVKHSEKLDDNQPTAVDVFYFFAASISTVGLGDIAPTSQVARAFAVMVIPLGLFLLSLQLSLVTTQRYSLDINTRTHGHPNYNKAATRIQTEFRAFRNRRDLQKNFGLSRPQRKRLQHRQQLKQVLLQRRQKASLFQNAHRVLVHYMELFEKTTFGRMSALLAKLFSVVLVGAIWIRVFLKAHKASDGGSSLSWTDSFYFATTIATSVGYGDIFPRHSDKWSKVFLTFYFIWSTVTLAMLLGTLVELLCELSDNSVVSAIIDSTIWVHKIDLENRGQVTESGYVLFKLMQMQKVDESCLNLLIDRWRELDANRDGFLQIGTEIPSAEQVVELQRLARRERSRTGKLPTLEEIWDRYRQEVIAQPALESSRERRQLSFS